MSKMIAHFLLDIGRLESISDAHGAAVIGS
jgi:hypothetical protein